MMDHYKNPRNRGKLVDPTLQSQKKNPFCGDTISVQLKVRDGKISDIKFDGVACAVTVASASMVTEELKGKTLDELRKLTKDDVLNLLGVELTTSRVKCATLVLEALHGMLESDDE